jgi:hypothetical protein
MYLITASRSSFGLEQGMCRYVSIKRIECTERTLTQNLRPLIVKVDQVKVLTIIITATTLTKYPHSNPFTIALAGLVVLEYMPLWECDRTVITITRIKLYACQVSTHHFPIFETWTTSEEY